MLIAKSIHYRYATHPVLEGASFMIPNGAKAGLVGPNGAGKTTLFGLLAGEEQPDAGSIEIHGSIGVVPQEVTYDPLLEQADTARQYIDPPNSKRDDELYTLLNGLELAELNLDVSPESLSGGQKTKLALIRQLIAQPDILLLDEPTNFLDVSGKHWVMNFLASYPGTLLIISHDLPLLDQALNKVLYLNPLTRTIEEYTGNYSQFQRLRKEREEHFLRQRAAQAKHIQHMEKSLSKLKRQKSESGVRRRVQMRRRIERAKVALPELPAQLKTMRFKLPEPANVGRVVIQSIGINKAYGNKKVLENVNFLLERGQKMALIGQNGAGKSTLLKILTDQQLPDSGTVEKHEWLDVGYYAQEHESFDLSANLLETVRQFVPAWTDGEMRGLLGRFMFSGDRVWQSVGSLSGGEKTRLAIALLTIRGHNLLILDEPTTYLDPLSQRIILDVLKDFKGAMIVVSHTEDFIRELEPDRALILPDNIFDFWRPEMLDRVIEV